MDTKRWLRINVLRPVKYFWQRRTRGFDDSELWNLDVSLAKVILPRLKAFRDYKRTFPSHLTDDEWKQILDKMIASFEYCASEDRWMDFDMEEKIQEGLNLFAEYFMAMWD